MTDPSLIRFLELLVRELGAADARVELGGRDPIDPRIVFRIAPSGGRVVVVFDEPPKERPAVESRLEAMLGSLFGNAEHALGAPPSQTPPEIAGRRLNDELERLRERVGANGAVVFDLASPVIWGVSMGERANADTVLESTIVQVRDARAELRPSHTTRLRLANRMECLARPFAGLYVIAVVFEKLESELTALGALLHAMPIVERLVIALPPVDPPPEGAKVVRLPGRLR